MTQTSSNGCSKYFQSSDVFAILIKMKRKEKERTKGKCYVEFESESPGEI